MSRGTLVFSLAVMGSVILYVGFTLAYYWDKAIVNGLWWILAGFGIIIGAIIISIIIAKEIRKDM